MTSESPLKRRMMKTGINLLKMAGQKVMMTNTLGLNESVIKARAEARTIQEAAVDQRRKADEETLRTKSIKDALRREKMADLEPVSRQKKVFQTKRRLVGASVLR
jgi:hypothetical protein